MSYWSVVFTLDTWREARVHGLTVMGFRDARWSVVQRLRLGDVLICYLKGHRRFVGALKVIGRAYTSEHPRIWASATYPARIPVEPLVSLAAEDGVPATDLLPKLEFGSSDGGIRTNWGAYLQGGPREMSPADGETILREVHRAAANPHPLPLDSRIRASSGSAGGDSRATHRLRQEERQRKRQQIRLQAALLELGSRVGLMTWAAREDHRYMHESKSLGHLSISELPVTWNPEARQIAEDIDVIWIRNAEAFACFEFVDPSSTDIAVTRLVHLRSATGDGPVRLFLVADRSHASSIQHQAAQAGCGLVGTERIGEALRAPGPGPSSAEDVLASLLVDVQETQTSL